MVADFRASLPAMKGATGVADQCRASTAATLNIYQSQTVQLNLLANLVSGADFVGLARIFDYQNRPVFDLYSLTGVLSTGQVFLPRGVYRIQAASLTSATINFSLTLFGVTDPIGSDPTDPGSDPYGGGGSPPPPPPLARTGRRRHAAAAAPDDRRPDHDDDHHRLDNRDDDHDDDEGGLDNPDDDDRDQDGRRGRNDDRTRQGGVDRHRLVLDRVRLSFSTSPASGGGGPNRMIPLVRPCPPDSPPRVAC